MIQELKAIFFLSTWFCRFEDEKDIGTIFEELWEENSSSERVTLQLYLGEVVALLCNSLASSSWASKRKVNKFALL